MVPTHLCIVRHGESLWNVEKRVQGQMDPDLTELGEAQAEAVARRLSDEKWDALYSSDLTRARKTAAAIAELVGLEVQERADLRERYQGCVEGMLAEKARELHPDWDAPEVGRESMQALSSRAKRVFTEIVAAHRGERVLVVTHGGLIRRYLVYLHSLGVGPGGVSVDNTSTTRVEWSDTCGLLAVNDTAHLEDGLARDLVCGGVEPVA